MSLDIAFPAVGTQTVVAPPAPSPAQDEYLGSIAATPATRKTLVCKALLQGDTRRNAEREAAKIADALVGPGVNPDEGNTAILMTYGDGAVEHVNSFVDRLLHEVEPAKIPELNKIVNDLMRDMRGVRRKYDPSDPKVREKYEHYKGKTLGIFGSARSLLELLWDDVQPLEGKMAKVEKTLRGKQSVLIRNVGFYDGLYRANNDAINDLINVTAVMEFARDEIARRSASIKVGDAALGDRGTDNKAALMEIANNLDIRIGEFKNRIFVAWASLPRIRMARSLAVTLAIRLDTLVSLTIPTMKDTIVEWRLLIETMEGSQLAESVERASNEALIGLSNASGVIVPQIARVVSRPGLSIQAVFAMAKSVEDQAQGTLDAFRAGRESREELDSAMMEAGRSMKASTDKLSDGLVDLIVEGTKKPLEIATSVGVAA